MRNLASPNDGPPKCPSTTARQISPGGGLGGGVRILCLCFLSVLCLLVVGLVAAAGNDDTDGPGSSNGQVVSGSPLQLSLASAQGPGGDYANFKHTNPRHASLACSSCHTRVDNSATHRFPGHRACIDCHGSQFFTPNVPMCSICHSDLSGSNPPLKGFPTRFKERFNVKFDHAQHNTGSARPASGCAACHSRRGRRAAALSIPVNISAHNQCYTCHKPGSKSSAGRDMGSCGACHDVRGYSRTSTNRRAYRLAFSHAQHGNAQRLGCADCHNLTRGAPQGRQVSSPVAAEHFTATRGMTCLTCHNGRRNFGGDLAFKDCRRCHTAASFRMPM